MCTLDIHSKPTSTLLPYTTLFRSKHCAATRCARARELSLPRPPPPTRAAGGHRPVSTNRPRPRGAPRSHPSRPRKLGEPRDRKSTRLNSSHVEISYAVFCLKKKIK